MLDPSIPALEPGTTVADVACGTGVWLLDAVDSNPNIAAAEGSDVVLDNVPPKDWLSGNVSFLKMDILEPLPDKFVGRYDIVNAQFASSFVRDGHIALAMENLLKMLSTHTHIPAKPASYTQTADCTYLSNRAGRLPPTHRFRKREMELHNRRRKLEAAGDDQVLQPYRRHVWRLRAVEVAE